jgi:prephenate dehydrogenase/ferredoxin-fold anticodon binding domain-containing protein
MAIRRIHIFGGARGIGRWFVEKVFMGEGLEIFVYDINFPSNPPFDPLIKIQAIDYVNGDINGIPTFVADDVFVIATPLNEFKRLASRLFRCIPDGCLVFDMSSVKKFPYDVMKEYSDNGRLSIMSIHPLFAPLVASPVGQLVILAGFDNDDEKHVWLKKLLKNKGLILKEATPELHDKTMLYVQVLTHFAYLVFSKVLANSEGSLSSLLEFKIPPFTFLTAFAGRLLGGNANTYANIQRQKGASEIRDLFIKATQEINEVFTFGDLQASVTAINDIVSPLTGAEVAECRAISSQAIDSLQAFEQKIFSLWKTRQLCGIKRIDTKKVDVGIIVENRSDRIIFESRIKPLPNSTEAYAQFAICTNDTAKKTYQRIGINFGKFQKTELLKRNIKILSDADLNEWVQNNIAVITNDINIIPDGNMSKEFYEKWLPKFIPAIVKVKFIEAYKKKGTQEHITLRITHKPELTVYEARSLIGNLLSDISQQ